MSLCQQSGIFPNLEIRCYLQTSVLYNLHWEQVVMKVPHCWVTAEPKAPEEDSACSLGQGGLMHEFTHPSCLPVLTQPAASEHLPGARACESSRGVVVNETEPCP